MNNCLNCGEIIVDLVIDYGLMPVTSLLDTQQNYSLKYKSCRQCFIAQVIDAPPPDFLYGSNYNFFSGASSKYVSYAKSLADLLQKEVKLQDKTVIEIGCNDGTLVKQLELYGAIVTGVDPFENGVSQMVTQSNTTIFNDFFSMKLVEKHKLADNFDIAIVNNVLSHTPNFFDFLDSLSRVVKPGGNILVEMADFKKILDSNRFDYLYHGIFNLILPNQMTKILSDKFYISKIFRDSFDPFSIKFMLTKSKSSFNASQFPDEHLKNYHFEILRWAEGVDNWIQDEFLHSNVIGYAANSKAGTALALSTRLTHCIDKVIDKNPYKIGKKIAGSKVDIVDINKAGISSYSDVILFASHLFDEVTKELKVAGFRGKVHILEVL